jgi:hypothetical protein
VLPLGVDRSSFINGNDKTKKGIPHQKDERPPMDDGFFLLLRAKRKKATTDRHPLRARLSSTSNSSIVDSGLFADGARMTKLANRADPRDQKRRV